VTKSPADIDRGNGNVMIRLLDKLAQEFLFAVYAELPQEQREYVFGK